jgi:hypothetical protein
LPQLRACDTAWNGRIAWQDSIFSFSFLEVTFWSFHSKRTAHDYIEMDTRFLDTLFGYLVLDLQHYILRFAKYMTVTFQLSLVHIPSKKYITSNLDSVGDTVD